MATKKQKRQCAAEKRQRMLAEYRRSGLAALQKEREHRFRKELQEWEEQHQKAHTTPGKRIIECPHCRLEMKAAQDAVESSSSSQSPGAIALVY